MTTSWKVTLPCTKAEAEAAVDTDAFTDWDEPPVLLANEPDEERPDAWELVAYTETHPSHEVLLALRALAPSANTASLRIVALADQDWVTLSQAGLAPIAAGRFYVHTPRHPPQPKMINFCIDAGLAFGTGQHATTRGCLVAIDALASARLELVNILDLGTGTGLLAFAALRVWPQAHVTASDIDPVSIEVSAGNAVINHVALGAAQGAVALVVADGLGAPELRARAPFDLIIANILAQPLIDMAGDIVAALAPGGRLILSGLLATQAEMVTAAYVARRMSGARLTIDGDWAVLVLERST